MEKSNDQVGKEIESLNEELEKMRNLQGSTLLALQNVNSEREKLLAELSERVRARDQQWAILEEATGAIKMMEEGVELLKKEIEESKMSLSARAQARVMRIQEDSRKFHLEELAKRSGELMILQEEVAKEKQNNQRLNEQISMMKQTAAVLSHQWEDQRKELETLSGVRNELDRAEGRAAAETEAKEKLRSEIKEKDDQLKKSQDQILIFLEQVHSEQGNSHALLLEERGKEMLALKEELIQLQNELKLKRDYLQGFERKLKASSDHLETNKKENAHQIKILLQQLEKEKERNIECLDLKMTKSVQAKHILHVLHNWHYVATQTRELRHKSALVHRRWIGLDLSTYFSHWQQIKWEVERHKTEEKITEACQTHEKELADMKAANTVLKAQLEKALADVKELQQQTVDRQAGPKEEVSGLEKKIRELSKNEVEIREQFENEIERLKKRMAESEILNQSIEADVQTKDSRLVEALAKVEAAEKELELKNAEVEELKISEDEEFKTRIDELEGDKQTLEVEVQRLHEQIEASDELLAKSDELLAKQEAEIQNLKSCMERAIELTKFLHEEVSRSSASITDLKSVGGKTVGISFSTENASACMVGGNDRQSNRKEANGEKDVMRKVNETVTGGLGKIIGRVGSKLLEVRDLNDLRADTIQMKDHYAPGIKEAAGNAVTRAGERTKMLVVSAGEHTQVPPQHARELPKAPGAHQELCEQESMTPTVPALQAQLNEVLHIFIWYIEFYFIF